MDRIILFHLLSRLLYLNAFPNIIQLCPFEESIKWKFCEDLDDMVQYISMNEKLYIGGDLNAHVWVCRSSYEKRSWRKVSPFRILLSTIGGLQTHRVSREIAIWYF